MSFTLQAFKEDSLASDITDSASSLTLVTGAFGTPTGEQMLVIDPDISAKREIVKCAIDGATVTSVDRAQDGTSAVAHSSGAKVIMAFVPTHYKELTDYIDATNLGWVGADETWTYASVDDPTGVFTVASDVSAKYSAGMKIKFTNGGETIYGIITAVSYSSPNTSITFLHEIDPTDSLALHLLADSAITANYYSTQKAPYGFPLEPTKWSVQMSDANQVTQNNPTEGVWYNLGSLSLSVPIGCWNLSYFVNGEVVDTGATAVSINVTLSTANDSASDAELITSIYIGGASGSLVSWNPMNRSKIITVTSKTPYYLNAMSGLAGMNTIYFRGEKGSTIIRAICAYL